MSLEYFDVHARVVGLQVAHAVVAPVFGLGREHLVHAFSPLVFEVHWSLGGTQDGVEELGPEPDEEVVGLDEEDALGLAEAFEVAGNADVFPSDEYHVSGCVEVHDSRELRSGPVEVVRRDGDEARLDEFPRGVVERHEEVFLRLRVVEGEEAELVDRLRSRDELHEEVDVRLEDFVLVGLEVCRWVRPDSTGRFLGALRSW